MKNDDSVELLIEKLRWLRLPGMVSLVPSLLAQAATDNLTLPDVLHRLADEEKQSRMRAAVTRRVSDAKFPEINTVDGFDFDFSACRKKMRARYLGLHDLAFLELLDDLGALLSAAFVMGIVAMFVPLGVVAVIPPWNFPLAILTGMATAALVAGNTVVLKPSSDSAGIATMFLEAAEEAGVPDGVLNFVTGPGSTVGNTLVEHPKTRMIAFTGSREVGLQISEKAGKVAPGQLWIKRAILEMGGKDFILVDETADLDEAASGVVAAAFGFQGQKCSACSRLIVHEKVHDELLEKIVARTKTLTVGDVRDPGNAVGAVINESSQKRILEYVDLGRKEGIIVVGGEPGPGDGFFVMPTIVDGVKRGARIAREEIFGPVLAVLSVKDFDEGIAVANDTDYGLTGSLYSRDRDRLARGKRELFCGNLYLNRKCTGALVGVHPFGGFNMSGTDSKAGGREYLYLFTQAKAISEKL